MAWKSAWEKDLPRGWHRELPRLPALTALRAFEAAARHESFSRAATELFVTHGAVSHQIRALEDELGLPLFERHGKRVALTPAGRVYAERVRDAPLRDGVREGPSDVVLPDQVLEGLRAVLAREDEVAHPVWLPIPSRVGEGRRVDARASGRAPRHRGVRAVADVSRACVATRRL